MTETGIRFRLTSAIFIVFLSLGLSPNVCAPETPRAASYEIEATFSPNESSMEAVADVVLAGVSGGTSVTFFLHGELDVDSIEVNGKEIDFEQEKTFYEDDYSLVATKASFLSGIGDSGTSRVKIRYGGPFHPSRARSRSDYMRIDDHGVFLRSYGYSLWFPVFLSSGSDSYPVTFSRVAITTPSSFTAVFTGTSMDRLNHGDTVVSVWKGEDVDLFDAQCTAREYETVKDGALHVYALRGPESVSKARSILEFSRRLVDFYRSHYKKTAEAEQIHVMEMPEFGDIASGNVVGISHARWLGFEPGSVDGRVLAHELVHRFVWIPTPRSDPLYALSVEGFPSYFHLLAVADEVGEKYYHDFLLNVEKQYLQRRATGKDSRGRTLPAEKALYSIRADEIGIYKDRYVLNDRALLFLNYLKTKMGARRFLAFAGELFNLTALDVEAFEKLILRYLPEEHQNLDLWLKGTEFPEGFRIETGATPD